jgi:hypothetical protein
MDSENIATSAAGPAANRPLRETGFFIEIRREFGMESGGMSRGKWQSLFVSSRINDPGRKQKTPGLQSKPGAENDRNMVKPSLG